MRIIGIDEVGRGCLAGPVVAGAVLLPLGFTLPPDAVWKLTDSKLLKKAERETAAAEIRKLALAIGLGWAPAAEVDKLGLTEAVRLAMHRALEALTGSLPYVYDEVVIDGNYNFLSHLANTKALIKADAMVPAVSAASIVAKVARDNWMAEVAAKYPEYGFESHVGYGTKQHMKALQEHGPCDLHRMNYRPVRLAADITAS